MPTKNSYLLIAGILTSLASLMHIAIIIGGANWYRFFGAGEGMATLAEQGNFQPIYTTLFITIVLAVWALYAFSGAGLIAKLPLLKPILLVITSVFLFRALAFWPLVILVNEPYLNELQVKPLFMGISSLICLVVALCYIKGYRKLNTIP